MAIFVGQPWHTEILECEPASALNVALFLLSNFPRFIGKVEKVSIFEATTSP